MEKCIMLGNGLNRCLKSNVSWGNLLETVAQRRNLHFNKNISFPMQFENIVNQILEAEESPSDEIYTRIKKEVVDQMKLDTLPEDSLQGLFANKADSVITTNYDHLIEKSLDSEFKGEDYNRYA